MLKVFVSIHTDETEMLFYSGCSDYVFKPCWKFNFFYYIKSYILEANIIGVLYPEAFVHPNKYTEVVQNLLDLSKTKTVLISTFSLDLIKEIEILKRKEYKIIYVGLNSDGEMEENSNYEYLEDMSILDVTLKQDTRFLNKGE